MHVHVHVCTYNYIHVQMYNVVYMYFTCSSALRSLEIAVDRISVITTALSEPGIKKINVRQICSYLHVH